MLDSAPMGRAPLVVTVDLWGTPMCTIAVCRRGRSPATVAMGFRRAAGLGMLLVRCMCCTGRSGLRCWLGLRRRFLGGELGLVVLWNTVKERLGMILRLTVLCREACRGIDQVFAGTGRHHHVLHVLSISA